MNWIIIATLCLMSGFALAYKLHSIKVLPLFICLLWLTSANPSWGFELKVTNKSNIDIFPTVLSGKSEERFGVVGIGRSATVGFSPFKLGDKIQISWEEGESTAVTNAYIDSSSLKKKSKVVDSVHVIYNGNGKWVLKAYDKKDVEVGAVP